MFARVEDLRKGDVVLVGAAKGVFEAKLLRQPCLAKQGKKLTWGGNPRWMGTVCAVREETIKRTYTDYHGNPHSYVFNKEVIANGKEYTKEKRIDFSEAEVWVIKREEI